VTTRLALITAQLQARYKLLADSYAPGAMPLSDAHRESLRAKIDAGFEALKAHWDEALFPQWPPGQCADCDPEGACKCSDGEPEAEMQTADYAPDAWGRW
jgi:anti-sigma-K factor RskA